jgi:hypothetical protein
MQPQSAVVPSNAPVVHAIRDSLGRHSTAWWSWRARLHLRTLPCRRRGEPSQRPAGAGYGRPRRRTLAGAVSGPLRMGSLVAQDRCSLRFTEHDLRITRSFGSAGQGRHTGRHLQRSFSSALAHSRVCEPFCGLLADRSTLGAVTVSGPGTLELQPGAWRPESLAPAQVVPSAG